MFNDADLEMAELEAAGNAIARAKRHGVCTHSGIIGRMGADQLGWVVPIKCEVMCSECGEGFANSDAWLDTHYELLGEWL